MKKFLSLVILIFLLTSLVSCNNAIPPEVDPIETDVPETDVPVTDPPATDDPETNPPETDLPTTDTPETEPPVVFEYTPSLSSEDQIEKIGVQIGDVIIELYHTGMNGQLYIESGMEPAFVDGYSPEIEDMPVLKLSAGEKITILNNMGYGNIQDTEYFILDPESPYELPQMRTGSEDSVAYPEAPGKYIAKIYWSYWVWNDPSNPTPEELIGRLNGYMTFYCILVVE